MIEKVTCSGQGSQVKAVPQAITIVYYLVIAGTAPTRWHGQLYIHEPWPVAGALRPGNWTSKTTTSSQQALNSRSAWDAHVIFMYINSCWREGEREREGESRASFVCVCVSLYVKSRERV